MNSNATVLASWRVVKYSIQTCFTTLVSEIYDFIIKTIKDTREVVKAD